MRTSALIDRLRQLGVEVRRHSTQLDRLAANPREKLTADVVALVSAHRQRMLRLVEPGERVEYRPVGSDGNLSCWLCWDAPTPDNPMCMVPVIGQEEECYYHARCLPAGWRWDDELGLQPESLSLELALVEVAG